VRISAREEIAHSWSRFANVMLARTVTRPYEGSLLAADLAVIDGPARLHGVRDATRLTFGFGFAYDTRDHETVTTRGHFDELAFRAVPGLFGADAYLGATATLRGYLPIDRERLSLAARVVGDVVTRNAPLFELSRSGGLHGGQAPGGGRGIRGIPQGRLLGRTKLIGNFEVRSWFLPFDVGDQRFDVGMAAFFDTGRVWTDTLASVRRLDGPASTPHWGAGGGPRLRWGDSLVIRTDLAYAPLGARLGSAPAVYVDVEQVM
jgi:outer membrane protein assembly factor BamA